MDTIKARKEAPMPIMNKAGLDPKPSKATAEGYANAKTNRPIKTVKYTSRRATIVPFDIAVSLIDLSLRLCLFWMIDKPESPMAMRVSETVNRSPVSMSLPPS
jgi:hypothetical protein